MNASSAVSAVLFAKDAKKVAAFYVEALGFSCTSSDSQHSALRCQGFELIIQQIQSTSPTVSHFSSHAFAIHFSARLYYGVQAVSRLVIRQSAPVRLSFKKRPVAQPTSQVDTI
jgi:catechol-2,3-dioxygenase